MKLPDELIPLTYPPYRAVYLASPYSHDDAEVRKSRFNTACRIAGELMNAGLVVFSPDRALASDRPPVRPAHRLAVLGEGRSRHAHGLRRPDRAHAARLGGQRRHQGGTGLAEVFGILIWFLNPHTLEFSRCEEEATHD